MLRQFIVFAFNFSHKFIEEVWGDDPNMVSHLTSKFDMYSEWSPNNPTQTVMRFMSELDSENLEKLEQHIIDNPNYK